MFAWIRTLATAGNKLARALNRVASGKLHTGRDHAPCDTSLTSQSNRS
jgi:hypothetical protein